jgi:nucleoside-diphosphate-sugar epimerase
VSRPLVLITGAGGFIGGWMAEAMHLSQWGRIRAGVSRWSSAARIARFPVEIVQCDIMCDSALEEALRGVDVVIHCARGKGNDNDVTEQGTQRLLERSARAGVSRFIYLSSVAVYGDAAGVVCESTEAVGRITAYCLGKQRAEALCRTYASERMAVSVIRPTLVYGPFSEQWTLPFIERLASGAWRRLGAGGEGKCNLVYVGDLVRFAQFLAEADLGPFAVFNGNGPDTPTWNAYIETFNDLLGFAPLADASSNMRLSVALNRPIRELGKYAMAHHKGLVLGVANRSPDLKRMLRDLEHKLRLQPTQDDVERFALDVTYSMDQAAAAGFRPKTPMMEGLRMTADWAREMGLVD